MIPGSGRPPGEGNDNPLQYLPGESHGLKSLEGYSPWGHKGSDMTNTFTFFLLTEVWENWVSLLAERISAKHGQRSHDTRARCYLTGDGGGYLPSRACRMKYEINMLPNNDFVVAFY